MLDLTPEAVPTTMVKLTVTAVLAVAVLGIRTVISKLINRRENISRRTRRRWMVTNRNLSLLILMAFCAVVWFGELRQVATALALVATGFVIATKEIWLNLTGYFYRSGAHFFTVGDRIEVGDFRGDVIDHGLAGATILEVGAKSQQYTGRAIFVPNSKFLTAPITNET
jgi:small-conductance mechanosensitive channel